MKKEITIVTLLAIQYDGDVNVDAREVREDDTIESVEAEMRSDMATELDGLNVAAITRTVTFVDLPAPIEVTAERRLTAGTPDASLSMK